MMMTTVEIGRLMLKSESNIGLLRRRHRRLAAPRPACTALAVLQQRESDSGSRDRPRRARSPRRTRRCAGRARRWRAAPCAACRRPRGRPSSCRRRARSPRRECVSARMRSRSRGAPRRRGRRASAASRRRSPPAPRPGAWWHWRRDSTRRTLPANSLLAVAVDAEVDRLARLHLAHVVGRHHRLEAHAGRVDHLQQLLADLRRVAGRDLALADHAVERRAHLGALQLLAREHEPRLRGLDLALRGVAADLGVVQRLRRRHARAAQRLHALELALRLVEAWPEARWAASGGGERVADRGVVERTSTSPLWTGSPFSL